MNIDKLKDATYSVSKDVDNLEMFVGDLQSIDVARLTFKSGVDGWECGEIRSLIGKFLQGGTPSIALPHQMVFSAEKPQTEELMRYFVGAQHGEQTEVRSSYYQGNIEKGFWSVHSFCNIKKHVKQSEDAEYEHVFIPTYFVTCAMLQIMLHCAQDGGHYVSGKHYLYWSINHLEKTLVDAISFIMHYIGNGNPDERLKYLAALIMRYLTAVFGGPDTREVFPESVRKAFEELIVVVLLTTPEMDDEHVTTMGESDSISYPSPWECLSEYEAEVSTVLVRNDPEVMREIRNHQRENPGQNAGKGST